jgi:Ca2+:H+ antiporter
MDLQFWPGAVVMVFIATLVAALITSNGRSARFVGALLLLAMRQLQLGRLRPTRSA